MAAFGRDMRYALRHDSHPQLDCRRLCPCRPKPRLGHTRPLIAASVLIFLLCVLGWRTALASQQAYETDARTEVTIPMRDGIRLSANVFLPKAQSRFPVILLRSPYGKDDVSELGDVSFHVSRGYVVVSQDCRGRGMSEGLWEPFANEAADGQDTHKWILAQPWCNGAIGTTGGSYLSK